MALYKGMTLKRLDYYVVHLPFNAHEKQLNAICEDVDHLVMINILLFQVSSTSSFHFVRALILLEVLF